MTRQITASPVSTYVSPDRSQYNFRQQRTKQIADVMGQLTGQIERKKQWDTEDKKAEISKRTEKEARVLDHEFRMKVKDKLRDPEFYNKTPDEMMQDDDVADFMERMGQLQDPTIRDKYLSHSADYVLGQTTQRQSEQRQREEEHFAGRYLTSLHERDESGAYVNSQKDRADAYEEYKNDFDEDWAFGQYLAMTKEVGTMDAIADLRTLREWEPEQLARIDQLASGIEKVNLVAYDQRIKVLTSSEFTTREHIEAFKSENGHILKHLTETGKTRVNTDLKSLEARVAKNHFMQLNTENLLTHTAVEIYNKRDERVVVDQYGNTHKDETSLTELEELKAKTMSQLLQMGRLDIAQQAFETDPKGKYLRGFTKPLLNDLVTSGNDPEKFGVSLNALRTIAENFGDEGLKMSLGEEGFDQYLYAREYSREYGVDAPKMLQDMRRGILPRPTQEAMTEMKNLAPTLIEESVSKWFKRDMKPSELSNLTRQLEPMIMRTMMMSSSVETFEATMASQLEAHTGRETIAGEPVFLHFGKALEDAWFGSETSRDKEGNIRTTVRGHGEASMTPRQKFTKTIEKKLQTWLKENQPKLKTKPLPQGSGEYAGLAKYGIEERRKGLGFQLPVGASIDAVVINQLPNDHDKASVYMMLMVGDRPLPVNFEISQGDLITDFANDNPHRLQDR